jgi:hypothetical protein
MIEDCEIRVTDNLKFLQLSRIVEILRSTFHLEQITDPICNLDLGYHVAIRFKSLFETFKREYISRNQLGQRYEHDLAQVSCSVLFVSSAIRVRNGMLDP